MSFPSRCAHLRASLIYRGLSSEPLPSMQGPGWEAFKAGAAWATGHNLGVTFVCLTFLNLQDRITWNAERKVLLDLLAATVLLWQGISCFLV